MTRTNFNNMGPGKVLERFIVSNTDLTTAGLTQTLTLKTLPKGSFVTGVRIKSATAFTGGGASACTVSVGSAAGNATTFSAAYDIFQAVADTALQMTSMFKAATYAQDTLQAFFTSVGANLNALTAGVVYIDVEYYLTEDLTGTGPTGNALATGGQL